MTFRVETTAQAERDGEDILDWLLAQQAGDSGIRWFLSLESSSIVGHSSQAIAPENERFPFEVRQLIYGHKPHLYRILYAIDQDTVYVLHIRHGRRQRLGAE